MKRAQLAGLELAIDQARDAAAAYCSSIETLAVHAKSAPDPHLLRLAHIAQSDAYHSREYLRELTSQAGQIRCDRMPCDRSGGICPRCMDEAERG